MTKVPDRGEAAVSHCKGSTNDGWSCINRPGENTCCRQALPIPDMPTQPLEPVSPIANPGDALAHPLEPAGGVTITDDDGSKAGRAKRQSRRRQDHIKGRKR